MLSVKQVQVRMYAPNGAEVLVSVEGGPESASEVAAALERMGLSPHPPAEHERERRSRVGAFVVRTHVNPDESITPVVDIYFQHRNGYTDRLRSMRVYLNSQEDVRRFEVAFGVSLQNLEMYDSDTPIERGKRPQQERFIHRPKRPVWVVWRLNPAADDEKAAPKRIFIRWEPAPEKGDPHASAKARIEQERGNKYPPGHQAILSSVRQEAQRLGLENPEQAVLAFLTASQKKPNVRITPAQARAWVRREFGSRK